MKIQVLVLIFVSWQVAYWGGNLNNGTNAGLWNANFNNSSGNTNANIGAQLSFETSCLSTKTLPLGKTQKTYNDAGSFSERFVYFKQMKRYGNLFDQFCCQDNIEKAYQNARKGKRHYREVVEIEKNPQLILKQLRKTLITGTFQNSTYDIFTIQCSGKERVIYRLPFYPDRIVHHALVQVLKPIWMNLLIRDTYSAIPGRGIHDGVKRIRNAMRDKGETKYCVKFDVHKYYPSVDHDILKSIIRKKVKDTSLLALLDNIIDSAPGIPIGNYISQWFGNLYLAYFDHYMKEQAGATYYFRYCDDIVILGRDKQVLWRQFEQADRYLNDELHLKVKSNYQVFPVDQRGIDFLGYRFFHDYTLVRKSIVKEFKKKLSNTQIVTSQSQASYWGWFKHADTYRLTKKYFNEAV